MSRTATDRQARAIRGARFTKVFKEWQAEGKTKGEIRTQESFALMLNPPVGRQTVINWMKGSLPEEDKLTQICKILEVDKEYFNTENATHDELYKYSSAFITEVGRGRVDSANKIGLDLDFVRSLTNLIDFDSVFPKYAPINKLDWDLSNPTRPEPKYFRCDHADSGDIDKDLRFLQIHRDGKTITLNDADIDFLKEVQDKIVEVVQFLFDKRSKEMDREDEAFNRDSWITLPDGGRAFIGKPTKEFVLEHDRFAYRYGFEDYEKGDE